MTEGYKRARRETLAGIIETAYLLARRAVEDGEDLEDVVGLLHTIRRLMDERIPP